MLNPRFDPLADYAFAKLRALLDPVPAGHARPLMLSLGEPQHTPPPFVAEILAKNAALYGKYPPIEGTAEFRAAVQGWLDRRFGLADGFLDPNAILPLAGTREGLFSLPFTVMPEAKAGQKPAVLMPNPFYQAYAAGAVAAGAEPVYVDATAGNGFLPDFAALPEALLARTAAIYLCSPANPQGSVAGLDILGNLIAIARQHDILLIADECYSEIYAGNPPPGILQAAQATGSLANVAAVHSLSKRSSLPGLRSGFVAGDPEIMAAYRRLRSWGGPTLPLPVQAASAAAWSDEAHVMENRRHYAEKFDLAERILGGRFGFYRPAGGFFLWLDVGDGETAALKLWREAGVRVLPGKYLAQTHKNGQNPATRYIRVALVQDMALCGEALERIVAVLDETISR